MAVSSNAAAPVETTVAADDESSAGASSDDETSAASSGSGPDGEPAPDFSLTLADGSVFSPSAEDKPIYMIFWAEW